MAWDQQRHRSYDLQCLIYSKHKQQSTEPLKLTPFPDYPWQKVATDLYVLVVDYYS